jgi:hypothetical protein
LTLPCTTSCFTLSLDWLNMHGKCHAEHRWTGWFLASEAVAWGGVDGSGVNFSSSLNFYASAFVARNIKPDYHCRS